MVCDFSLVCTRCVATSWKVSVTLRLPLRHCLLISLQFLLWNLHIPKTLRKKNQPSFSVVWNSICNQCFASRIKSHSRIKGPGVRYEIGMCIQTRWIVWVNGPYPCGEWSDLSIATSSLMHLLDDGERYLADGGHRDANGAVIIPTGNHTCTDSQRWTGRARH